MINPPSPKWRSRQVKPGEHIYLWDGIPKPMWERAVQKAGGRPMKYVLVDLLTAWADGNLHVTPTGTVTHVTPDEQAKYETGF